MDWLTDLLKHLAISRSVAGATFVTAIVLFFGPRMAPSVIEPVPKEWVAVVLAAMVFSGSLLFFWTVASSWRAVTRGASAASKALASTNLTGTEQQLLVRLGINPNTPLNIDGVDYSQAPFTKLEMLELAHSLAKKGLVDINPFNEDLISLSAAGRKRALEIQRQIKGGAA